MNEAKPFEIDKRLVYEAYKSVRLNKGSAGIGGIGIDLLQNLLPYLKRLLLKAKSVLNIDETWCRVRIVNDEFQNEIYFKKYIWVLVNKIDKLVYFLYDNDEDDSRGTRPIATFLEGFIDGILYSW